jgi:hypothetical protein
MTFPLLKAQPCSLCPVESAGRARAAVVLSEGVTAHVCQDHLLEMIGDGQATYPVFRIAGAAWRTAEEAAAAARPPLRVVGG